LVSDQKTASGRALALPIFILPDLGEVGCFFGLKANHLTQVSAVMLQKNEKLEIMA
jgi:hypothetical protein